MAQKTNCEQNVFRRFLEYFREEHLRLNAIFTSDALIHKQLQKLDLDLAKATGLCDRKWVHIALILIHLRSRSRVSFRAGQNPTFEVVCVYPVKQSKQLQFSEKRGC